VPPWIGRCGKGGLAVEEGDEEDEEGQKPSRENSLSTRCVRRFLSPRLGARSAGVDIFHLSRASPCLFTSTFHWPQVVVYRLLSACSFRGTTAVYNVYHADNWAIL
jgi:hypothetical protein